ncbi:cytochrome P450 [Nocardioidaceae bacterium]|nr:cytochrome P450 [Nocardioidaceae bacterium]
MALLDPAARVVDRVRQPVRWGVNHAIPRTLVARSARNGDLQGQMILAGKSEDHWAVLDVFEQVRAKGTLHQGMFGFVTTDLAACKEVLTSADFVTGFPTDGNGLLAKVSRWAEDDRLLGPLIPPSLLVTEPPDHTRYRKLVTRVFTVKAVEKLRERAEQIAHQLLDDLEARARAGETVELVEAYCSQLPVTMIAEILGVPESDRHRVLDFGQGAAPSLDLGLSWGELRRVERSLAEFDAWLGEHLAQLAAHPGEDLLSQLAVAQEEGVGLTDTELKSTAGLVLAAGFETTVNLLGNGAVLLREHPEQLQALREDPALWGNAVDEMLRIDPPVLLTGRLCVRDTEIAGHTVPAGWFVTTALAGANRDPQVFDDPGTFDVRRENAKDHVAFSSGRHYCLGAALARMEGEVGLKVLFDRYPDLELAPGRRRRPTRILRGWSHLPVTLGEPA